MFEQNVYQCPQCGAAIREKLVDGEHFECSGCHKSFYVLLDEATDKVGFVEIDSGLREPLGLPRGSVRAAATLLSAVCCWVLMLLGKPVPGYLLNLLATVVGYYFAFRQKLQAAQSRILDASVNTNQPLHMPGHSIRVILILGFAISGVVLAARGMLLHTAFLEFFLILAGLVVGYFFARIFSGITTPATVNALNHVKALVVLVATLALVILLLSGRYAEHSRVCLTFACVISFYFGSRS